MAVAGMSSARASVRRRGRRGAAALVSGLLALAPAVLMAEVAPGAASVTAAGPDAGAVAAAPAVGSGQQWNDYPTLARADYIFGCLAANGQDRETMRRCACSIDVIASILPYEAYVSAETVLSMRLAVGERAALFRVPATDAQVAELRRAQAEAEMVCF